MSSIIPGYEYDIFISYRHKDNMYDGWVTEFVKNLKKELEATFKEDVSIYFDENPHDGLLDTHVVEDSLATKLKCEVLIPIISQTYCDPKSFAWTTEFLGFKKMTLNDQVGLKVKLANGNIGSRILPVRINNLDSQDHKLLEDELDFLRSIDFIYEAAGVNRPLRAKDDDRKENINNIYYRDQVNKVANAIKEIIVGIRNEINAPNVQEEEETNSQKVIIPKGKKTHSPESVETLTKSSQVNQFQEISIIPDKRGGKDKTAIGTALVEKQRPAWAWPMIAVVTLIAGFALGWKFMSEPQALPSLIRTTLLGDSTHRVANACCGPSIAISQDGKTIAFLTRDLNNTIFYVQRLDEFHGRPINGTENSVTPFFSPDGNWLGFVKDQTLMKVDLRGGTPVTIADVGTNRIRGANWTNEGTILYSPVLENEGGIYQLSSEGGIPKQLTMPDTTLGEVGHVLPQMLPGGKRILYVSWSKVGDDAAAWISIFDLEDSSSHRLIQGIQPFYSETGHIVYALADGVIMAIDFDIESMKLGTDPVRLTENVMTHRYADTEYSVSLSGSLVYRLGDDRNQGIHIITMDGITVYDINIGLQENGMTPRFSPNGSQILYSKLSNLSGRKQDLWLFDFEANIDNRLTTNGLNNRTPVWSNDGKSIRFVGFNSSGENQFKTLPVDMSSPAVPFSKGSGFFGLPSRSGGPIPFTKDGNIWLMDEDGSNVRVFQETTNIENKPAISPSKRWLAYDSDVSGTREIYVQPFPKGGARYRISTNGGDGPIWATDGQLVYHTPIGDLESVDLEIINDKPRIVKRFTIAEEVYNSNENHSQNYDVSPDGETMVIVSGVRNYYPTLYVEVNRLQQLKSQQ